MIGDIRKVESVTGHLLAAVGRAFFKIVTTFLGFAAVGFGGVEGVSFFSVSQHPSTLTHIAAGVFAAVLGYAAGLTMAVTEAIRGLIEAGRDAVKEAQTIEKTAVGDVTKIAGGAEGVVGNVARAIGNEIEHRK